MKRLSIFIIMLSLFGSKVVGQDSIWKSSYRNYIVNADLKDDKLSYSYEVRFTNEEGKQASFETSSLDTFKVILKKDMTTFQADKQDVLMYFHGYLAGQIHNFRATLADFKNLYIDPEESDIARVIGYRWPGNNIDYPKSKSNAHQFAAEINAHFRDLVLTIQKENDGAEVNVITHSLGSELFKEMMSHENGRVAEKLKLGQVAICAPDLDEDEFCADKPLTMAMTRWKSATVYHSDKDFTLTMSKNFNNKNRLGLDGPPAETITDPKLLFIDTSQIADEDNMAWRMTGHSYVRASARCGADILSALIGQHSSCRTRIGTTHNTYELEPGDDQ